VRTGNTPVPDNTWGQWSMPFLSTPADLRTGMPVVPNDHNDSYIQVQFTFKTQDKNATPRLKEFDIAFVCGKIQ
jgi:hypothetical protein